MHGGRRELRRPWPKRKYYCGRIARRGRQSPAHEGRLAGGVREVARRRGRQAAGVSLPAEGVGVRSTGGVGVRFKLLRH